MSKVDLRMPQIARLRVQGQKDSVIAAAVGLTPAGLARILSLPEYKDIEQAVLNGTVTKMDQQLAGNRAALMQEFKVGVPLAMRTLLEAVQQRRDLRTAMAAASEILDRDPDRIFSKAKGDAPQAPTLDGNALAALAGHADTAAKQVSAAPATPAVVVTPGPEKVQ